MVKQWLELYSIYFEHFYVEITIFRVFQSIYQLLLGGSDGIFANIEVWNIYKLNILGEKKKSSHVTKGSFSSVSRPVGSSEMTNTMKFFKQIHIYIAQFQKVHVKYWI